MPKVTPEHRAARRAQIIAAARRRFAANGFHLTSMEDVITESGLSAGALYGYFPSKSSLIEATIEDTLDLLGATAREVLATAPEVSPGQTLADLVRVIIATLEDGSVDPTVIALFAWAEAPRNPELRAALTERYRGLRAVLSGVAREWFESSETYTVAVDDATVEAVGKVLLATLMGFVAQRAILGDLAPPDLQVGLDALARLP
ncbi:MAG TPA: TetR/AcrR family transcriptional regulator [Aldersonia sp.]